VRRIVLGAQVAVMLAFPNGAAPEIIDHGRTGYLCHDEDDMTAAVARLPQISRQHCRAAAERRFSLARMAADYDRLYQAILETPGRVTTGRTGTGAL
jgi:glycosyltransferase involved in cell wall biosynthesis